MTVSSMASRKVAQPSQSRVMGMGYLSGLLPEGSGWVVRRGQEWSGMVGGVQGSAALDAEPVAAADLEDVAFAEFQLLLFGALAVELDGSL